MIARTFPADKIEAVLAATGKTSVRQRELPAHVVVCYVIAWPTTCSRPIGKCCLLEGLQWLREPGTKVKVAGNSAISRARSRLGASAPRQLHDEVVQPVAAASTQGAWYRRWRLVGIDGSTLDIADQKRNEAACGGTGGAAPTPRRCGSSNTVWKG